jgi:inosine-uridine nucleoside N-ribohydrolase
MKSLAGIFVQGQATMYSDSGHATQQIQLEPSIEEFNLREDPQAAEAVMDRLQVPLLVRS